MSKTIHPTAIVDPLAELADGVEIGPYAIIEGDVVIGADSKIHHHSFIGTGARIGERCQVHHAAVVSNVPQDLKFKGTEKTYVELGDDCTVREFATIHRATIHDADTNAGTKDGVTRVGAGSLIMAYAHVAHDCFVGEGVILSNLVQLAGHVSVEKWVTVGGGCLVHQFGLIGALSMVGGGAEVRKDVPPFSLVGGGDAKFSGINRIGLQRRGIRPDTIRAIKSAYFTLYNSGLNVSDAVQAITESADYPLPEIQEILDFIARSKRGIIGAA
ncbi:MAG TPA: acyl-ACP--UDP-N-acetylglucosamine O-acyltransferase [Candidatus Kapabacteria bacterium]|jgi:UDP-N-acetylglucosamine acyltransferase|nr:acyl-ACP--UDP-N-acetylglucosamine O-acyltransferase [Candidatus Kapabacteria bacterium]